METFLPIWMFSAFDFGRAASIYLYAFMGLGMMAEIPKFCEKHRNNWGGKFKLIKWIANKNKRHFVTFAIILIGVVYASFRAYDDINSRSPLWHDLTQVSMNEFIKHAELPPTSLVKFSVGYNIACKKCEIEASNLRRALESVRGWQAEQPGFINAIMQPDSPSGIIVFVPLDAKIAVGITAISNALMSAHIPFKIESDERQIDVHIRLYVGEP